MNHSSYSDSHAHLNHHDFDGDIEKIAEKLESERFQVLNVAYDLVSAEKAIELARRYPFMRAAAGIHPHDAGSVTEKDLERLRELSKDENVVAIGETGLDYFRNRAPKEDQQRVLIEHLKIAREAGKPVIIHCRDAFDEIVPILKEHFDKRSGGVLHCFSEGADEAVRGMALGFHISFAGNVTYKKAEKLREAAKAVRPDLLLIETDCPYLTPQSNRGKRNEPLYIKDTAAEIAKVRGVSQDDVARVTTANYGKLFLGVNHGEAEVVYWIRDSLYINVTRSCTNNCYFCHREDKPLVQGHYLGIDRDRDADEIISLIGDARPSELVFCGFGEPTERLEVIKKVGAWAKENSLKTRLNTNGHGNLINGRDIVPELAGIIDIASVSLNAPDMESYNTICKPDRPEEAFDAMIDFIKRCRDTLPDTVATAVDLPSGVDLEKISDLAESLGVRFRLRSYDMVGQE